MQTTVEEALWISCRLRFTNDVDDLTAKGFVGEVVPFIKTSELNVFVSTASDGQSEG